MRPGTSTTPACRFPGVVCLTAGLLLLTTSPDPVAAQAPRDVPSAAAGAAARSLIVPGWGQQSLGQRRSLVYAMAEATLWAVWAERRHKGNTLRTAYRDLAWREGRVQSGSRADPSWAYYEALSKWMRSGAFDRDPQVAGVQPELDERTFNGSAWSLAVDIHFPRGVEPDPADPAYAAALAWYSTHAYGEAFLWDWSGKEGELEEYKDLIHRSDRRFSQATAALGAVLANHVLSATDAFVSARVPGEARLRAHPPTLADGSRVGFILSWNPPW